MRVNVNENNQLQAVMPEFGIVCEWVNRFFSSTFGKSGFLLVLFLAAFSLAEPNGLAQVRSSEDIPASFRVTKITTVEMDHPKTGEHGLALVVEGKAYGLSDTRVKAMIWSEGAGNVGYAFPLAIEADPQAFMAAIFIPVDQARRLNINSLQIHFRRAWDGKLLDTHVIADDRYK